MLITTTVPPFTLPHTECIPPRRLQPWRTVVATIYQTVKLATIKNLKIRGVYIRFKMHKRSKRDTYMFLKSRDKHVLCSPRQQCTLEFANPAE